MSSTVRVIKLSSRRERYVSGLRVVLWIRLFLFARTKWKTSYKQPLTRWIQHPLSCLSKNIPWINQVGTNVQGVYFLSLGHQIYGLLVFTQVPANICICHFSPRCTCAVDSLMRLQFIAVSLQLIAIFQDSILWQMSCLNGSVHNEVMVTLISGLKELFTL